MALGTENAAGKSWKNLTERAASKNDSASAGTGLTEGCELSWRHDLPMKGLSLCLVSQGVYMGAEVASTLPSRPRGGRPMRLAVRGTSRRVVSVHALMGMGLWLLLWLGYNTGPGRFWDARFPTSTSDLIHGIRSYCPELAAWISFMVILGRSSRLVSWIIGPLGLMLVYAITGMTSSLTMSPLPFYAFYWGANYLSIVFVMLAVVLVEDPIPALRKVLDFTWAIGMLITLALLYTMPKGGPAVADVEDISPVPGCAYNGSGEILGMASTRNTGFARYAAISALVSGAGLMRKGKLWVRAIWGVLLSLSLYALYIANGRTEIVGFLGGVAVLLLAEKAKRTVNIMVTIAAALVLGFEGIYADFFLYFTRTGHVDTTMTGRTSTWDDGWRLLSKSPVSGLGFHADRFFLGGTHMHNAFLHVLVQSGILGGGAIVIGLAIVWYHLIRYFFLEQPTDKSLIPPEIPAVFTFVTISSVTESTFAYFSAAWLLSAPIVAYVMALHRRQRRLSGWMNQERAAREQSAKLYSQYLGPSAQGISSGRIEEPPKGSEEEHGGSPAEGELSA